MAKPTRIPPLLPRAVTPAVAPGDGQTLFTLPQAVVVADLVGWVVGLSHRLGETPGWTPRACRDDPPGLPPEFAAAVRRLAAEVNAVLALAGHAGKMVALD